MYNREDESTTSYRNRESTWVGLYTSPIGAFLSERTIGEQTRKVPMLAKVGKVEKGTML